MTDEPNVLMADAQERIAELRAFLGSDTWVQLEEIARLRITRALDQFEQGKGDDAELRGEIRAYRHVLSIPRQMVAANEGIINNNRGK